MDIQSHVVALNENRIKAAKALNDHLDECVKTHPGQPLSEEERAVQDRMNAEIDGYEAEIKRFVAQETREAESAIIREANAGLFTPAERQERERSEVQRFAAWARGETGDNEYHVDLSAGRRIVEAVRAGADVKEARAALLWDTGSVASGVPTEMSQNLYQHMTAAVAMLTMPTTKIVTAGGAPMEFPKVNAHGIATQVIAQGTAIGGTDPTFTKMTLGAYKYGQLLQLSNETLQDTGFDILGFVASNIARAVAEVVDADLVVGTGTGEPLGVMSAIVGAGTIATGGSLIDPTYEKLIDLVYSVNSSYRNRASTAWLMHDLSGAALRKMRDGAGGTEGAPLWQPSTYNGLTWGEPDRFLGYPVYTDPNVASLASNAKSAAFGDFSAYYIRIAEGFTLERSDDYAFNTDLVTFRGKTRVDGDLIDTTAINAIKRSV